MPGCVCLCLPNRGECVFVCVVHAKENLVCAAAMVCAIVTLIVSIFLCECVCGWLSLQKSRPLQRSHETATGWRSWCCHFTHGVRACVFLCVSMFQARGEPKKKYCVRAYERGSAQKYYWIKFVILHFSSVLLVKWQTCVCCICTDVTNDVSTAQTVCMRTGVSATIQQMSRERLCLLALV